MVSEMFNVRTPGNILSEIFYVFHTGNYFLNYSMSPHRENAFWNIQCPHTGKILPEIFNVRLCPHTGKNMKCSHSGKHVEMLISPHRGFFLYLEKSVSQTILRWPRAEKKRCVGFTWKENASPAPKGALLSKTFDHVVINFKCKRFVCHIIKNSRY